MSPSNLPIFRDALAWRQAGRAVAMACVVETWGSAPRPPGSRLVVDADGNFSGSVSGGCVEAEVIGAAVEVMQADAPRLLEFGVADETAWRAGLSCGGRLKIYVENVGATQARLLEMLADECAARRACVLVTDIDFGRAKIGPPGRSRQRSVAGPHRSAAAAGAERLDPTMPAGGCFSMSKLRPYGFSRSARRISRKRLPWPQALPASR